METAQVAHLTIDGSLCIDAVCAQDGLDASGSWGALDELHDVGGSDD